MRTVIENTHLLSAHGGISPTKEIRDTEFEPFYTVSRAAKGMCEKNGVIFKAFVEFEDSVRE